jgi:phosphatidylglycerophosphate synthase
MATDSYTARPTTRAIQIAPLSALLAQMLLITGLGFAVSGAGLDPTAWAVGIACAVLTNAGLSQGLSHFRTERISQADWVTLVRASLAVGVAALVADSFAQHVPVALLVSLASVALALDYVDGWVARRTQTSNGLGALWDGEVDAFLILVLSVYVARSAGVWVLAIGLARYAFLAAGWAAPWMRAQLPPLYWRKFVAGSEGVLLAVAAAGLLSTTVNRIILVGALVLLAQSFGRDVLWLRGHRADSVTRSASERIGPGPGPDEPGSSRRQRISPRVRRALGIVFTTLSVVLVWAALVLPDHPGQLTIIAFLRIPVELLVIVLLALVLPKPVRRIMAVLGGAALTLVVLLKVIEYGFYLTFDRAFDPIGDTSQLNDGIFTLKQSIGATAVRWVEIGAVAGIAAGLVLFILALVRITDVAARQRRWALRSALGLGGAWLLLWGVGAQLLTGTPAASAIGASVLIDNVKAFQGDLADRSVFEAQIKHDPIAKTPTSRLLTSLKGKNVLLVFVEAYGQLAVQGAGFSGEVDRELTAGDKRLSSAGFQSRSGFLDSATFGGISWLAHSSVQSGLWVDSQLRYNQLMPQKRFTLAEAFKKTGYRTVDDIASDNRPWTQGERYYHYNKIYDRKEVGYKGPTFTYASMPDQYIFNAFDKRELNNPKRTKPLFAEIDTVSSHMPWNKIPKYIPWNKVGNGSIYNRIPMLHYTGNFWGKPARVKKAYGKSIVYSMHTLTSWIQHKVPKNTVVIALGDHQPLPIVSGTHPNHDVPISIISHDPKVVNAFKSWGWNTGLQPRHNAPVLRMSAFRNKFLNTFDTPASKATK